jgi:hypothetical protein
MASANLATRLASFTGQTTATASLQDLLEADEGTRTLDLLHGKQTL